MKLSIIKLFILNLSVLSFCTTIAQNLVINGNFESYSPCPTAIGQINAAVSWDTANHTTPDYFNACSPNSAHVPSNALGFQAAHSGQGYAGFIAFEGLGSNWREYLQGRLTIPLEAGMCYHFEMYVSSGDDNKFLTDDFGVYFSANHVFQNTVAALSQYLPVVSNLPGSFPNTTNWTLVSGEFIAAGGEQYILIGNFKPNSSTTVINNSPLPAGGFSSAYFYVDDVLVVPCGHTCTTTGHTYVSTCVNNLPYSWNGQNYLQYGTYSTALVSSAGCDSLAILHLLVYNVDSSTTNVTVCSSQLPYNWNGSLYSASGSYRDTLTGSHGCDSIVKLNLLVISSSGSLTLDNYCSAALPYEWNGNSYTSAGVYTTVFTSANGCDSIAALDLSVRQSPFINIGKDTSLCATESIVLTPGILNASYLWQDGSTQPTYTVRSAGLYWVKVTSDGCDFLDSITVLSKSCNCIPGIPSAFTPNGDGINDHWKLSLSDCNRQAQVSVYNRFGSLVYKSESYNSDWMGTWKSKPCPDGTYYYVIRLISPGKPADIVKGNVTIIR